MGKETEWINVLLLSLCGFYTHSFSFQISLLPESMTYHWSTIKESGQIQFRAPFQAPFSPLPVPRWGRTQTCTRQLGNPLLEQTKTVLSFCIHWHIAIISFLPPNFSSCSQFGQCHSVHCPLIQCSALCVYDPHVCALSFSEAANITPLIPLQIDLFELYLHDKTLFSH